MRIDTYNDFWLFTEQSLFKLILAGTDTSDGILQYILSLSYEEYTDFITSLCTPQYYLIYREKLKNNEHSFSHYG